MDNEKPTNGSPHDDALAALHGLGDQDTQPDGPAADHHAEPEQIFEVQDDAENAAETAPSPSASGFVGMLSKSNVPQDEPAPSRPVNPVPQITRPTPQPMSQEQAAASSPRAQGTYEIRMAREIAMPDSGGTASSGRTVARTVPRSGKTVPGWYHVAVPIMFTLSSLLLFIGLWALGAVAYVMMAAPQTGDDIHYPLISWDSNIGDYGGISVGSKIMAFTMLVALPVAICLVVMAIIMRRQVSNAEKAAARG